MLFKENYRELKKSINIKESHQKMVEIPNKFLRFIPHPYLNVGAIYKRYTPFFVRKEVLKRLVDANSYLESLNKGYRLKIFDAYRPLSVQRYMIEYDKERLSQELFNTSFIMLKKQDQESIVKKVTFFWSPIVKNIEKNPPPHSTGGAIDLTICSIDGKELDMGTKIDSLVKESLSDYYDLTGTIYEQNRTLLKEVMQKAGFTQLPTEWWHYSYGDQIWAVDNEEEFAIYGMLEN
jgi:D-alanyl-D-alanine dipeptidase